MSLGPQHGCDISANGSEESKITRNGTSFSKETAEETYAADFASEVPDSSQSPSDVDSHCFGLVCRFLSFKVERTKLVLNNRETKRNAAVQNHFAFIDNLSRHAVTTFELLSGQMIQQEKQECIICQIAAMTQLDTIKVQAGYHTSSSQKL